MALPARFLTPSVLSSPSLRCLPNFGRDLRNFGNPSREFVLSPACNRFSHAVVPRISYSARIVRRQASRPAAFINKRCLCFSGAIFLFVSPEPWVLSISQLFPPLCFPLPCPSASVNRIGDNTRASLPVAVLLYSKFFT